MESQPQNPEFRNNPERFHPCNYKALNQQGRLFTCGNNGLFSLSNLQLSCINLINALGQSLRALFTSGNK